MDNFYLLGVFIIGIVLLIRASGWLVSILFWMARFFKISEYGASFLLMAAATSIPELFVGINSAFSGIPELSLGNVLGANLLNMTLVLGIPAILSAITLKNERATHGAGFILALTAAPFILTLDGVLSRFEGAMLIVLFFAYLRYTFAVSKLPDSEVDALAATPANFGEFVKKLFLFIGGVMLLLLASRILVFAASLGAERIGVPAFLIGLIVVSFGTTLPELSFGIRSALSGRGSMGVGNAIGSVVFNLLFILGTVSLIQPITLPAERSPVFVNLLAVTALALFLHIVFRFYGKIGRGAGAFLVLVYIALAVFVFQLPFS